MKTIILSTIFCFLFISLQAQDTAKKEYLIKYEVQTKKGEEIGIGYFDKNEVSAGGTASELWTYSFTTTNKDQNIQIYTVGGRNVNIATSQKKAKIWVRISIYVNGNLIKSAEEKFFGLGPTIQVNLNDIK